MFLITLLILLLLATLAQAGGVGPGGEQTEKKAALPSMAHCVINLTGPDVIDLTAPDIIDVTGGENI